MRSAAMLVLGAAALLALAATEPVAAIAAPARPAAISASAVDSATQPVPSASTLARPPVAAAPSLAAWNALHRLAPPQVSPAQLFAQSAGRALTVPHLAAALYGVAGVPGVQGSADGMTPLLRDGSVEVSVTGPSAYPAARAAGSRIVAADSGAVTATIAPSKLRGLAGAAGVNLVAPIKRAFSEAVSAESVGSSGAAVWQSQGRAGAGAVVAVVDGSFGNLAAEVAAGNLPAGTTINGNYCADPNTDSHGTAVAEIVHQLAPGATLQLYCIDDTVGLAAAGTQLLRAGAQIVSCSLGFAPDARGDGTGFVVPGYTSAAVTVARLRKAGVLWVNAAGNSGTDHWDGTFADANQDGFADLHTTSDNFDQVVLPPGASTEIALSWDQWPASKVDANLRVDVIDPVTGQRLAYATGVPQDALPNAPVRVVGLSNVTSSPAVLDIRVTVGKHVPRLRYDLSYLGDVSPSYYSAHFPARAAQGSIAEPASSPYALAVGAAYWATGAVEDFSSRGPTVDGRTKPDLIGFDGVSSNLAEFGLSTGNRNADLDNGTSFFGTSAAAPNVAGAAALVKAANPAMDASQIEALLEKRASHPANPANNGVGHGLVNLGDPSVVAPEPGAGFTPIAPVRVLDTRIGVGTHPGPLGRAGQTIVRLPAVVPANATAVVINLTGTGATVSTYLSVFPDSFAGTSNLNLSRTDPTAAVNATVALNAAHAFNVRNAAGHLNVVIDVVGYYAPSGAGFGAVPPFRVLDTRTPIGGHHAQARGNENIRISVAADRAIPADATAVAINLTATNMRAAGYVSTAASVFSATSTLNYTSKNTRANFAVVSLAGRAFKVRNSGQPVDLIVDVVGYYAPSAAGRFHTLPSPVRLTDTRTGNGGRNAPLPSGGRLSVAAAGIYGVPYAAIGVIAGVTVVPTGTGFVTAYPAGQVVPRSSTVNYSRGRVVPNATATGLGGGSFTVGNSGPAAAIVVDEFGYFAAG